MKGYHAFSYQDISRTLGVKNAAIHYHYPAKEDLGCTVIKESQQSFEDLLAAMQQKNYNERQKLDAFLHIYLKSRSEEKVCIVGSLSPAFHTLGGAMQVELQQLVDRIWTWVSGTLEEGRKKGLFAFKGDARTKALMIITNMLAGLQLARVSDKVDFQTLYQAVVEDLQA
jgi:3-oxoacyl-[acyl-carrier-protein] synthase II/TetR/AcrR family transcriptional repressor of nem operon